MIKQFFLLLSLSLCVAATETPKWGLIINTPVDLSLGQQTEASSSPQLFIPIRPQQNSKGIVFIDLRSYFQTKGAGANISLGYRHEIKKDVVIGGHSTLFNHSEYDGSYYSQLAFGVEVFSKYVDASINFYAPLTGQKNVPGTSYLYARLNNNNFELVKKDADYQGVMPGMDLNVKVDLPPLLNHEMALLFSVYNYWGMGKYDNIFGFTAAAQVSRSFDFFGLDAKGLMSIGYGYDANKGHTANLSLGFKIALGGKNKIGNTKDDIYSSTMMAQSPTLGYHVTESEILDGVVVVNDNQYSGMTTLTARDDVAAAVAEAGEDSLVLLSGADGAITVTESIVLNEGQAVIGEGQAFVVNGPNGEQAVLLINSPRAKVCSDASFEDNEPIFILTNNTLLASLDIEGYSYHDDNLDRLRWTGVKAVEVSDEELTENVTISDVNISYVGSGITINYAKNVNISDVSINEFGTWIANSAAIKVTNSEDIEITNSKTFRNACMNCSAEHIYLKEVRNALISGLEMSGGYTGIYAVALISSEDIVIQDSILNTVAGIQVTIQNSERVTLKNNEFKFVDQFADFYITGSKDVLLEGNTITHEVAQEDSRWGVYYSLMASNNENVIMMDNVSDRSVLLYSNLSNNSNVLFVGKTGLWGDSISLERNPIYTFDSAQNLSFEGLNFSVTGTDCGEISMTFDFGAFQCQATGSEFTCPSDVDLSNMQGITQLSFQVNSSTPETCQDLSGEIENFQFTVL